MLPRLAISTIGLLALVCALALSPAASGVEVQPGGPCPTEGASTQLGHGWVTCTNGTWQPSSGPESIPTTPSPSTPSPTPPGSGISPVKAWKAFMTIGTALSPSTFASDGQQVADVTAVRLSDGRIRLFAYVNGEGVRTATSTNAKGTSFVADATLPIPWTMAGQSRVVSLGGDRIRLFYTAGGAINAAISTDGGLTFTDEGAVITESQAGFEPGGLTVVRHKGVWRGYFSNLEKPGEHATRIIRTATSTDMLKWTMGPVITQASGSITDGGSHPFALVRKGKVALYYAGDRGSWYGILVSTSTDGVTFRKERSVLAGGGDPDILPIGRNTGLLYYGADLGEGEGFGIKVARSTTGLMP